PLLPAHVTDADKLPHASSLCGACRDACPVMIDLPRLLLDLRADQVVDGEAPWAERQAMKSFLFAMQSRTRYEQAGRMAGLASRMLASLSGGAVKTLPPPLSGWTNSRDFPPFAKKPFRQQWAERLRRRKGS